MSSRSCNLICCQNVELECCEMDVNIKETEKIKRETPTGILRTESGKSRRASVEFKFLKQGEPTSPQPSVDRFSVTFAEDSVKSDSSKCNYYSPRVGRMDKVHFPQGTDIDDSDEEDYSASVNAIIQRRASTRKSRRRSSRRASSPFSPDILLSNEGGRRRSSVFTTSSGDTAITMDEGMEAVSQEEIFENIKLHKEVLSNVKMQPWNMRKKLKLVVQAKAYIKQHEGALQERLAQSRSTRDMLARWNIYLIKKWQHYRRELANLSNWLVPWERKIKEIESHFGSVVASYFLFLRWLFWVNVVLGIVLISFVAVPEYVAADRLTAFPCEMWFKISLLVCCTGRISGVLYPIRSNFREAVSYSPPEDEVTFHLYHRSNFSKDDQLFIGDIGSILNSRFNPDLSTKIIIHGWTHGRDVPWVVEMREAMAELDLWNIIVVDWAPLSHAIYTEARIHTGVVSRQLTSFCIFMAQSTGIRMSSVHMIGHSMGAQIAASAGYKLQLVLNQTLARISGLDPAAPLYEWPHVESLDEILDPGDASFVDVIHTNGRHLGTIFPSGHVDYYPNGGQHQPGCGFWVCSHMRSCEFWTASVKKPDLFKAYSFQSWDEYLAGNTDGLIAVPMGIAANPSIPYGSYFLETTDEERAYLNTTTTILDSFRKRKKRQRR
ncbi:hypothetical protein TcasGA2_TC032516 [Tribolium castaneum]|uniref:Lipase domain-containing protein n=1 Tax=Tribolium castaneum TaxID=7070 RepID=A0A139WKX1_TRICA|nr:hypothetical protein TcasGA2_TC032516 [Tribolium castaneum]